MLRRICTPGSHPDTFGERLRNHGTPGACGQFVLWDQEMTSIANPRDPLLYGPGLDMLWVAGDGNRPTIWNGAALAPGDPDPLMLGGAPVAEVAPYQLESGADVALEGLNGATTRRSIVARDPAAGQDAVVIALWSMPTAGAGGETIFGTRVGAQGIHLALSAANRIQFLTQTAGGAGASTLAAGDVSQSSISFAVGIYDRTAGTAQLWTPGGVPGAGAVAAGAIAGAGIGIACRPNGGSVLGAGSGLLVVAYLIGAGIAPLWSADTYYRCRELRHRLAGTWPRMGGMPTFTRATARSRYDRNGRLWIYSSGMPAAGDSEREGSSPTRINKCYRNIGIPVGALAEQIGDDASTATGVADVAALAAAGLASWGPNVCSYVNATGATRYIRCGAATAAVTRHALSVHGDIIAGAGPRIGWWDTAGPGWTDVGAAPDNYARAVYPDIVPPSNTCVCCIAVPNGCTYYWIAEQCEGSGSANECTVTSPIPNWSAVATAQRNAESMRTALVPPSDGGAVEIVVEPQNWGGAGNTVAVLYNSGAGGAVLYADITTGTWTAAIDGTTVLDSGVAPVDGTAHRIRLRWVTGVGMSIEVRDMTGAVLGRADGPFDGSLSGAGGVWEIAGGPVAVSDFRMLRNGGG